MRIEGETPVQPQNVKYPPGSKAHHGGLTTKSKSDQVYVGSDTGGNSCPNAITGNDFVTLAMPVRLPKRLPRQLAHFREAISEGCFLVGFAIPHAESSLKKLEREKRSLLVVREFAVART
jgi:hypothetical protein